VLKGVGDDAQKPRWTPARRKMYDGIFVDLGGQLSDGKCFFHKSRSIIAELVYEHGRGVPCFSTSVLVAPPGGSKGTITWNNQSAAMAGDPGRFQRRLSKSLWRNSPYYYTWRLADRLGIPISAEAAYGGVGIPLVPKRSLTDNVAWLQFLSQAKVEDLIAGLGLAIGQQSNSSYLDKSARQWLRDVITTSEKEKSITILSPCALSDEAMVRTSIKDAFRSTLGRVRGTEFYLRPPPVLTTTHNPSVRIAVRKFQRKVRKALKTPIKGYQKTIQDLDRKSSLFFATGAGFLPSPWNPTPSSAYGLERGKEVKERYIAPFLRGIG